jgi:hypothetical protein
MLQGKSPIHRVSQPNATRKVPDSEIFHKRFFGKFIHQSEPAAVQGQAAEIANKNRPGSAINASQADGKL